VQRNWPTDARLNLLTAENNKRFHYAVPLSSKRSLLNRLFELTSTTACASDDDAQT